jgi:hypothetical protein
MKKIMADSTLEDKPVYIYNFDWPSLWLSHPGYKLMVELFDLTKIEVATILKKDIGYLILDDSRLV